MSNKTLVIGLDPGTGSKSPCGYAAFCPETKDILTIKALWTKFEDTRHRIKDISDEVGYLITNQLDAVEYPKTMIFVERFVMRGASGETLQQLIGGLMTKIPYTAGFGAIYNTTVKSVVGGTGKADKAQVAEGVAQYFKSNKTSSQLCKRLLKEKEWDIFDALAIGIAGLECQK